MACDRKRAKFILAVLSLSITAETEDCVMMTIKHDDLGRLLWFNFTPDR